MSQTPAVPSSPSQSQPAPARPVRRRGGQPGNLNAFKHGLYLTKDPVNRAFSIDPAQLADIDKMIDEIKKLMRLALTVGLRSSKLSDLNETLRCLGAASTGLDRLIMLQQRSAQVSGTSESSPETASQLQSPDEVNSKAANGSSGS